MDARFHAAPTFYQIFTIIAMDTKVNLAIPFAFSLMQSKDSIQYAAVLEELKKQLLENKLNLSPQLIICDFEASLHLSIKKEFPYNKIRGCYFNLVKSWWGKAQNLGLKAKEKLPIVSDVIFKLKIMMHLPEKPREEYLISFIKLQK